MRRWGILLWALLLGCSRCGEYVHVEPGLVDCREDLDCFIARARTCLPATVIHRTVTSTGTQVVRHEVVAVVRNRCHLRRTQLQPDPRFDGGALPDPEPAYGLPEFARWKPDPYKQNPHLMQCLYSNERAAQVMERLRDGTSQPEDLEPCYPGDGSCGQTARFVPGCYPDDCVLGRVIFSCDTYKRRDFRRCEGTRHVDPHSKCRLNCRDGRDVEDCRPRSETLAEFNDDL